MSREPGWGETVGLVEQTGLLSHGGPLLPNPLPFRLPLLWTLMSPFLSIHIFFQICRISNVFWPSSRPQEGWGSPQNKNLGLLQPRSSTWRRHIGSLRRAGVWRRRGHLGGSPSSRRSLREAGARRSWLSTRTWDQLISSLCSITMSSLNTAYIRTCIFGCEVLL